MRAGVAGLGCLPALSHGGRVTSAWCPRLGISASWSVRVKRVVGKRPAHSPPAGCAAGAGLPRRASRVAPSRWTAARLPPGPCGGPSGVDLGEMRAGTCSWERSSPQTWFSQHLDEGASSREYGESNSLFLTVGNFWAFFCQAVYMLFLTCRAWISFIPGHLMCTAFWLAYTFALACLILK